MTEQNDPYLLPCSCGRKVPIQPCQAGENVRCECGRECTAPTMGEIRRLPRAARSDERPKATIQSKWGVPQRLFSAGVVVLLLACVLAAVLVFGQYTDNNDVTGAIQQRGELVHRLKPWEGIVFFRQRLAPGIDTPIEMRFSQQHQRFAIGIGVAIGAGAIGMILAGIGIARIMGARSRPV